MMIKSVRWLATSLMMLVLCACSDPDRSRTPPRADLSPAEQRVDGITIRATTMPASQLNAAMAREYGIRPTSDQVLLVIGLRRGSGNDERSIQGQIQAEAVNLLGGRQTIALREVHSGEFVDYVGTAHVELPDTLRFFVDAKVSGKEPLQLRFHRDFFR